MSVLASNGEIDFLPQAYRARRAERSMQRVRYLAASALLCAIAAAATLQSVAQSRLRREAAAIDPTYQECVRENAQLAELQRQLQEARLTAELLTTLRQRWPSTQLVAAVVRELPAGIELEQLHVAHDEAPHAAPRNALGDARPRAAAGRESQTLAAISPLQEDLDTLRARIDERRASVELVGLTADLAELHRYVAELDGKGLVQTATLESIEQTSPQHADRSRFRIRLSIRPAPGAPGSPTAENVARVEAR